MFGLNGRIARIDLTKRKVIFEKLEEKIVKQYLGGLGIAIRMLYDEVPPEVGAFDPKNKLIFMIGMLTSIIPSTTRHVILAKSPLSGILGESYSGGYWGYELRKSKLDGIIIEGKASEPVYIWNNNGHIEIKDASKIWELDALKTQISIKEALGDNRISVACIGQAGENLVRYACVINERDAAGRCGLGAVMGSKNLKAIAVRGDQDIKELVEHKEEFKKLVKEANEIVANNMLVKDLFRPGGTTGNMELITHSGDVPHKYWKMGSWERDSVFKTRKWKKMIVKHEACYFCPVRCKKDCELKDSDGNVLYHGHGPEYETTSGFGPLLLNDDYKTIFEANELCNRYGLDTISCSETIGFAMECWEKGIITKNETEGIELDWGNKEGILKIIEKIAFRKGLGKILSEGVALAAKKIGKNSSQFAITVKGVELGHHDPRAFHSMGLTYAISTHGANHNDPFTVLLSWFPRPELGFDETIPRHSNDPKINSEAVKIMQDISSLKNSLIICLLVEDVIPLDLLVKIINAASGLDLNKEDLYTIGERIFTLKRMFGVRCGISKKDDTLPKRLTEQPLLDGGTKGHLPNIEEMLPIFYKIRGWSSEGIPTNETIKRLGLIVD